MAQLARPGLCMAGATGGMTLGSWSGLEFGVVWGFGGVGGVGWVGSAVGFGLEYGGVGGVGLEEEDIGSDGAGGCSGWRVRSKRILHGEKTRRGQVAWG